LWLNGSILPVAASPQPRRAALSGIPNGQAGSVAITILRGVNSFSAQAGAIQSWVQNNIEYRRDPPDVELVQTPQVTLQLRAGDCDDQSVLTAALLQATGHPTQFIAVGMDGSPMSHVLTQTLIGTKWVAVETIQPRPLGWMPSGVTSYYIQKV
jgi:transglutaminase-like putative cysteine protease